MFDYHVEVYRYLRDHAKPVSLQDAADLAKVRSFGGLAEAAISKRRILHQRNLCARPFQERPRLYPETKPQVLEARNANDFYKQQMALLGGTRTVAPADVPVMRPEQETWREEKPKSKQELWPERKPLGPTPEQKHALEMNHLIAMGRAGLDVDMFRVLSCFKSYDKWREAIK